MFQERIRRAPADPNFRVIMKQPRRSDGSFTAPGKVVLLEKAQWEAQMGDSLWERYRNKSLRAWGWRQLHSELGASFTRTTGLVPMLAC